MKNKSFLYSFLALVLFSLQSCVSNYAVMAPQAKPTIDVEEKSVMVRNTERVEEEKPVETVVLKADDRAILATIEKEMKRASTIDGILSEARSYLGTPYRLGGMTRSGIDCSAFVLSVYGAAAGISLPRISSEQAQEGERVEKANLEKGDLLFFQTAGRRISHVGIVKDITPEGEIKFIHASTSKGVVVSSLNEKYWGARYRFAKRVLKGSQETL